MTVVLLLCAMYMCYQGNRCSDRIFVNIPQIQYKNLKFGLKIDS